MNSETAKKIKSLDGWKGDAALYELSKPVRSRGRSYTHVIVSAVVAPFTGPETYIFPATPDGEVANYGELPGSGRGFLDHAKALRDAGYTLEEP
jgi:hypothetical protein